MAVRAVESRLDEETADRPTLTYSIGVMAYNEAANIGRLLRALLDQRPSGWTMDEIIVLASGCTDNTEAIVQAFSEHDARVKLVVQPRREGKASAVNLFLQHARSDILVLAGADTIPEPTTIEHLLAPFTDPDVGMTGARPVPVNLPDTFMGFAVHLLWDLHHRMALEHPKLGELTAFRRVFHRIPYDSPVDEANIEPLVIGQGYQLRYVPAAIVLNRGPETVRDFVKQRRRIYAGHLKIRAEQGYTVSTMSAAWLLGALMKGWRWDERYVLWTPAIIALELYARYLGWVDFTIRKHDHTVWEVVVTTKGAIEGSD